MPQTERVHLQAWIPRELADRVRARASAAHRSIAGELGYVLAGLDEPITHEPASCASATLTKEER